MAPTIPGNLTMVIEAHKKWVQLVKETESLMAKDAELQRKAAKGLRLKERHVPPEVLGGLYAKYCSLANQMYEAYLDNRQLQRAPYIADIITIIIRRLYELRQELVKLIVNDYIYVDSALIQQHLIPQNIEVIVPCHLAMDARKDSVEELLQTMWAESVERLAGPTMINKSTSASFNRLLSVSTYDVPAVESEPTIITVEYIQATIIQSHERYRQYFMKDYRSKCIHRRMYFAKKVKPAPKARRITAAIIIQQVYRRYMELKRKKIEDYKRDVFMGIVPDPWKGGQLDLREETRKLYALRRPINERTRQMYKQELEKENVRLIRLKKDVQIDDITEHIREWFKEWFYGYGLFPQYPYEAEGGTILVIRGDYPTIEEKIEMDEKEAAATKGKTKENLKEEAKRAKEDAMLKEEAEKDLQKKLAKQEYKFKCNPFADPGYKMQQSRHMEDLRQALERYNGCWSLHDRFAESSGEVVYGYIKSILSEDLMSQMHKECRLYVDELMRLELKLLVEMHKLSFKIAGLEFPATKPRRRPPPIPEPTPPLTVDSELLERFQLPCAKRFDNVLFYLFDLGIITKPTAKINDIIGDSNYAAYECNTADPYASFPPPGYGDVRRRLVLSCAFGAGLEPGAPRNRAVLLLGPPHNGKSFLVDCVAGEMNAVKIDVSPEVFSSVVRRRPGKAVVDVFLAARVFQPCVVFMRNVERMFIKPSKLPSAQRKLKANKVKGAIIKCVKAIALEDKIIFIGTCSTPSGYRAKPMLSIFDEIILVPRTDYGSLQLFFYHKLQSIRSVERDFCVHTAAQMLQGYGFGAIMKMFNRVMSAERIVRLNVTPLSPAEFIDAMEDEERLDLEDYKIYEDFFLKSSSLKKEREVFLDINAHRAEVYEKMKKIEAAREK